MTPRRRRLDARRLPLSSCATGLGLTALITLGAVTACGSSDTSPPPSSALHSQIGFGFDVVDLETDHQFPGQLTTFHVSYQYRDGLQGAGFDPAGHPVPSDTYPYFQDVENEMTGYIRSYPDKSDFYEVFVDDVARDLMTKYPQLSSLDIRADVPAYAAVPTARSLTVHVSRS